MESNKKESKFAVAEPKWQPEKSSPKQIISGLLILMVACFCAVYVRSGIDKSSEPSLLGFIIMLLVGVSVAYCLQKVVSWFFFKKK